MKSVLRYALVLLVVVGGTTVSGQFPNKTLIDYYGDDAFLDHVGIDYFYCNNSHFVGGSVGSWRVYNQYSCWSGSRTVHKCQQTNGTGGWIDVACPPSQP